MKFAGVQPIALATAGEIQPIRGNVIQKRLVRRQAFGFHNNNRVTRIAIICHFLAL